MRLLGVSCLVFLISNLCLATNDDNQRSIILHPYQEQCQTTGYPCQQDDDCCSHLICYSIQDKSNACWPSKINEHSKRNLEDFLVPIVPYHPKSRFHSFGLTSPSSYNVDQSKQQQQQQQQAYQRKKLEWNNCRFHEDCGEGSCCYVHFRFRSLPKSFCRPNRGNKSDICEPLSKYHSFKHVPIWNHEQQADEEQGVLPPPLPSRIAFFGRQHR